MISSPPQLSVNMSQFNKVNLENKPLQMTRNESKKHL